MGVPKFYRWISERYPCLSEELREYQIPTFDNLYLDMNGIIHTCSHPNDFDPHFRISEEKIFKDIFHYIEVLFRMIQPQKLFFMAVDGVAPRAKMNQQRGRRFRSAKEADVLEKKAQERGEVLPKEARFDSNCITPGTVFMTRLHEQLKYFVTYKISTDPLWRKCQVILSGHKTPGEGEHKIMDYIRYMKAQPNYDSNTRHCLYGLDADLIMLGLCTHEPHFSLLREEVKFVGARKRIIAPEEQIFHLLHLSLLREYLELEFISLKDNLPFTFDIEKIIDDWVLMGFLVGNDFIPPLPDLHISNGALPVLYKAYIEVLPSLGGYINEGGTLNLERFQKYMEKLSAFDLEQFKETYADLKYFEAKTGRKLGGRERKSYKNEESQEQSNASNEHSTEPGIGCSKPDADSHSNIIDNHKSQVIDEQEDTQLSLNTEKKSLVQDHSTSLTASSNCALNASEEKSTDNAHTINNNNTDNLIMETKPSASSSDNDDIKSSNINGITIPNVEAAAVQGTEEMVQKVSKSREEKSAVHNSELAALIKETEELLRDNSLSSEDEIDDMDYDEDDEDFFLEFRQHKRDYYMNKLEYSTVTEEVLRSQAECFVRAIQWNLNYYYNGVCSWSWFYPHHYAPFMSDVRDFSNLKLEFDMGVPFLPFQQLLAVLPAASKTLLPDPYQDLMVSKDSPIIEYYPVDFKTDLNGKKQEWEAVVLIPFIDEAVLLDAMKPLSEMLSPEETERNTHGPALLYTYTDEDLGSYISPEYFPTLANHHAKTVELYREDIHIDKSKLVKGLCKGAKLDVYFPGFPTLKHLKYTSYLDKKKVKIFELASRGENMILKLINEVNEGVKEIAKELLGKNIFVGWPHLIEAKVISVSSREYHYSLSKESDVIGTEEKDTKSDKRIKEEKVAENLCSLWSTQKGAIKERYLNRWGVDIGDTKVLLHCTPIIGRKYVVTGKNKITMEKQWDRNASTYALQATVKDISVHDSTFIQFKTLEEIFPIDTVCFFLGHPHYGAMGEVKDNSGSVRTNRVKISMTVTDEPNFQKIHERQLDFRINYMPGGTAAQRLGISSHLLSRITGTIYIVYSDKADNAETKTNVGLNLKFSKRNEEIPGYTKKDNGVWLYSYKAVELVSHYMENFPELFDYLSNNTGNDIFFENEIFPDSNNKVLQIADWLKKQPYYKIERQSCGAAVLDPGIVEELEKAVDIFNETNNRFRTITMQVKPHLLYKSSLQVGCLLPDPNSLNKLYDRVISVRESYTVPLGLKGTIIGIHKAEKAVDTMFDVLFDKPFAGGMVLNCSPNRGYRVPCYAVLNLSHGSRAEQIKVVLKPPINSQSFGNSTVENPPYLFSPAWNKMQQHQSLPPSSRQAQLPIGKLQQLPAEQSQQLPTEQPQQLSVEWLIQLPAEQQQRLSAEHSQQLSAEQFQTQPTEQAQKFAEQPLQSTEQPLQSAEQPLQSAEQSLQSAEQPLQSAEQPLQSTEQPLQSTEQPLQSAEQPLQSVEQLLQSAEQPLQSAEQPLQSTEQPLQCAEQPLQSVEQPLQSAEQPLQSAEQSQLSAEQSQLSAEQLQQSTEQLLKSNEQLLKSNEQPQQSPSEKPTQFLTGQLTKLHIEQPKQSPQHMSSQQQFFQQLLQQIPQLVPQQLPQQLLQQTPQQGPQQMAQQFTQQTPQQGPQQLNQQFSQQVPQQLSQQLFQQYPQQLPQQLAQQLIQQLPQQLPQQRTQHLSQPVSPQQPQSVLPRVQNAVTSHPNSAFASWRNQSPNKGMVTPAIPLVLQPNIQQGTNLNMSRRPQLQQSQQSSQHIQQTHNPSHLQYPHAPFAQNHFRASQNGIQPQIHLGQPPFPSSQLQAQILPLSGVPQNSPQNQNTSNISHFLNKNIIETQGVPSSTAKPSEFQLMWNELQNLGPKCGNPEMNKGISVPLSSACSNYEVNDSGTELLKKMLRIPEDPEKSSSKVPAQQNVKQVSVQEIFEHALTLESKVTPSKDDTSFCIRLIQLFHVEGFGLPRYNYFENSEDKTVTAQVHLPSKRSFTGEKANNKEQASENAAKIAWNELCLERSRITNMSNQNPVGTMPLTNHLPSPPQNWRWPQNQSSAQNRFSVPQDFSVQQTKQDWRCRNDSSGHFMNPSVNNWNMSKSQVPQSQHLASHGKHTSPVKQLHTPARTNWRDESRQPSQFVPLQAVKQQRNKSGNRQQEKQQPSPARPFQQLQKLQQLHKKQVSPKTIQLQPQMLQNPRQSKQVKPQALSNTSADANITIESKNRDIQPENTRVAKENTTETSATGNNKPPESTNSESSNSNETATKVTSRQKKSRIAANFSTITVMDSQ